MNKEDLVMRTQASNCLLCNQAPCTAACNKGIAVDKILRSLRFENERGAQALLPTEVPCVSCTSKDCMQACNRRKIDETIQISKVIELLGKRKEECIVCATCNEDTDLNVMQIDLTTEICGVTCENPFFLSSSVVGSNYEMVAKAFDMGWAGVAFKTVGMFVPEEVSPRFEQMRKEVEPFIGFKNIEQISDHTLEENLSFFRELKKNYPSKIIIASIMGQTVDEWTKLAKMVEEAGADIVECNFSCPHMSGDGLGSDVGTNVDLVTEYTKATRKGTRLPILAKMTPNITNMEIPAVASIEAGADGIAAINTIKSIMNIDLNTFVSSPCVDGKSSVGGYSGKAVKPIALRFIHDMKLNDKLKEIPISGMGGIETWRDAVEFIVLGCSTIQITTAVMQYGYRIIDDLIDGISRYMKEAGIENIAQLIGNAMPNIVSTDSLNRHSICFPKFDRNKCVACGRCYISCYDGGHQALRQNEKFQPIMDGKKCVGCHLCLTVCPVGAITAGTRVEKL